MARLPAAMRTVPLAAGCLLAETRVLLTSAAAAAAGVTQLAAEAAAAQASCVVHLGVDSRATMCRLERCAFNDASFRVPDEEGFCPRAECVLSSLSFGASLATELPLDDLVAALRAEGHDCVAGCDPGRFVCNYVYARSLHQAAQHPGRRSALFVHVPPFTCISCEAQLAFLCALLSLLGRHLASLPLQERVETKTMV